MWCDAILLAYVGVVPRFVTTLETGGSTPRYEQQEYYTRPIIALFFATVRARNMWSEHNGYEPYTASADDMSVSIGMTEQELASFQSRASGTSVINGL